MDWQPIESAPKDGVVLVGGHWPVVENEWLSGQSWWNIGTCTDVGVYGSWDDRISPTHWMPLPEPPSA